MILVDSSVWIDFFRARDTPQTIFLKTNLTKARWGTADLVLAEVLQGARDDRAAARIERTLLSLELVTVGGHHLAVEAARNYRRLRARGVTVRSTIDTLIATHCLLEGRQLLYSDRDFDPFVEHLRLRPAPVRSFGAN